MTLAESVAASSTEVEKPKPTVAQLIDVQKHEIARALPRHLTTERFARIVLTECKRTKKLLTCTPSSLLGSMMQAAQLGLEPGPLGQAYLVPYNGEVSLIIGYRGYIDLARRSGQLLDIVAREVRTKDDFAFEYGSAEFLRHVPKLNDRGETIAYYGIAKFPGGGQLLHVMDLAEIAERRNRSKAKSSGPWVTDPGPMSRKTVIRAMSPYLPMSPEFAAALAADEGVFDFRPDDTDDPIARTDDPNVIDVEPEPDELSVPERIAEYRATKVSGATKAHRELDEFLNDSGIAMDLVGITDEQTAGLAVWLDAHPIGST